MKKIGPHRLYRGDCLKVLRKLEDNSIDSIVTDPPYGISFMGRKWDYDVPSVDIWKECLRVLKPGGHLLAFAGTRTQHRMTVNIENAGFEIRDMIAWVYGCYSEDTECFTDSGWKSYKDIRIGTDKVLQWDSSQDCFTWYKVREVFTYKAPKDMIHFQNRHTNQLLTPNHRVYLKYKTNSRYSYSDYTVLDACDVKKSWHKTFPLASELHTGIDVPDAYLIGWWLTDAWVHGNGKACMFSQAKHKTLAKLKNALESADCVFSEYVKKHQPKHKDEHTFYVTGALSNRLLSKFPKRELTPEIFSWSFSSRLRLLEGLMDGDGSVSDGRQIAETFWSKKFDRLDLVSALCSTLGIRNHIDYHKGAVYLNRGKSTTELQGRHTVEAVTNECKNVWCLKTKTGAFLVRRAGRPFISGNSGFPKSLDISKAIDATLIHGGSGAKQIKKTNLSRPGSGVCRKSTTTNGIMGARSGSKITNNNPETTEALKYAGFGTALKPALEPITLARKPIVGTVANNVLKHGTGALNIDGCRVHSGGPKQATAGRRTVSDGKGFGVGQGGSSYVKGTGAVWSNEGRFPANLIHDGSEEVIDAFPDAPGQQGDLKGHAKERQSKNGCFGKMAPAKDHAARIEANKNASRFFYTAKASKQDRDEGNTHPTVKPRTLMRYLVRLVTPQQGICLDPFMGSGTTGVACQYEGFHFVGIEREKEYFSICKMRVRKARRLWREAKKQDTPNTTKDKKCQKKRSEKAKASPKSRLKRKSAKSRQ